MMHVLLVVISSLLITQSNGEDINCRSGRSACRCQTSNSLVGRTCNLRCRNRNQCANQQFTCRRNSNCVLRCGNTGACSGATLRCPLRGHCYALCRRGACTNLRVQRGASLSFTCRGDCSAVRVLQPSNQVRPIRCGQTLTGVRTSGQLVTMSFTPTRNYNDVVLESCNSDHDTVIYLRDRRMRLLDEADDDNDYNYARCRGSRRAGDLVTNPRTVRITRGSRLFFQIGGYSRSDVGRYSALLVCRGNRTPPPRPTPPPTPPPVRTPRPTPPRPGSCPRHRKPWHLATQGERQLYIDGFRELARRGYITAFTQTHATYAIHGSEGFLPWHRYFIWAFESQVRRLGGRFSCFSLPYWDWTHEIRRYGYNMPNYFIFRSGLGHAGRGECARGWEGYRPWSTRFTGGSCLRRNVCRRDCNYDDEQSVSGIMSSLTRNNFFGNANSGFAQEIEGSPHGWAHNEPGGLETVERGRSYGMTLSHPQYSSDDPIFYLLHAMIDMVYSLWQDCRNHENVASGSVNQRMFGNMGTLDRPLRYDSMSRQSWSAIRGRRVTPRSVFRNQDLQVSYDEGSFFENGQVRRNSACRNSINRVIFRDQTRRRRLAEAKEAAKRPEPAASKYAREAFEQLEQKMTKKATTTPDKDDVNNALVSKTVKTTIEIKEERNVQLFTAWHRMTCEYNQLGKKCVRPKYFDDCSSMARDRKLEYDRPIYDIKISLKQMIDKVEKYPCMVKTRRRMFRWARQMGQLYKLCRGDFDNFCDKSFDKEEGDTCAARMLKEFTFSATTKRTTTKRTVTKTTTKSALAEESHRDLFEDEGDAEHFSAAHAADELDVADAHEETEDIPDAEEAQYVQQLQNELDEQGDAQDDAQDDAQADVQDDAQADVQDDAQADVQDDAQDDVQDDAMFDDDETDFVDQLDQFQDAAAARQGKLTELERIAANAVLHGVVFSAVLLAFVFLYQLRAYCRGAKAVKHVYDSVAVESSVEIDH